MRNYELDEDVMEFLSDLERLFQDGDYPQPADVYGETNEREWTWAEVTADLLKRLRARD